MAQLHRRVGATAAAALALGIFGALASAPAHAAKPSCTVDFSASSEHPAVGQNITLKWHTSGADQLVASWTTADVPFTGTQVTTERMPGPVAYQVTGLKSGQYCGGAVVNVVYAAVVSSTPAAPSTSPRSTSVAPSSSSASSSPPSSSQPAPTTTAAASSSKAHYPAQSPTGGSSTPWYDRPLDLLILGALSLLGSIALFNHERVRAVLVRRH